MPTLLLIADAKGLSQSDLARATGVSRQAVSAWSKRADRDGNVTVRDGHLMALSRKLKVSPRTLQTPLGGRHRRSWQTELLWDRLYPSIEAFALAVAREEPRALARLVERVGLFRAANIAGGCVWERFEDYAGRLQPAKREGLRRLWQIQSTLGLT